MGALWARLTRPIWLTGRVANSLRLADSDYANKEIDLRPTSETNVLAEREAGEGPDMHADGVNVSWSYAEKYACGVPSGR